MRLNRVSRVCAVLLGLVFVACDDGTPPAPFVVELQAPGPTQLFSAGDTLFVAFVDPIEVSGGDPVPVYTWWVTLHHDTHVHPFHPETNGAAGFVVVPRGGHDDHNIFLRVYGRVVKPNGDRDSVFVDVHPRLSTIELTSAPAGVPITVDGVPHPTPFKDTVIVGTDLTVGAPLETILGSTVFAFDGWADSDSAVRVLRVPQTAIAFGASYDSIATTNLSPNVTLTSPAAGSGLNVGASASLQATATDTDGSVVQVEFLVDNVVVGSDASSPYAFAWTVSGAGARVITARATDNGGAVRLSNAIEVSVQPSGAPSVTALTPTDGTLDLNGAVNLAATVADDGPVSFVEFRVDDVTIATDSSAPFESTLATTSAWTSGVHVLRARARDVDGNYSAWTSSRVTFGGAVVLPDGFARTTITSDLDATPTAITVAPDGRIFVTEQTGALRVIKNGVLLAQPFITLPVSAEGERGLLGIAFDPDFATNGWLYLYHTTLSGGIHNRVSRFTAAGDTVATGSEVVILDLPLLGATAKHSGGAMRFGADGALYIAVGDDGTAANAPSLSIPFGKVLRIERDGQIPVDNPFFGQTTGVNRTIWARGLRNPFTFDIDAVTGRMHINDVGLGTWEEVNVGRAGAHYGWPESEGPTADARFDAPLLAYPHDPTPGALFIGNAAVGAAFYRPAVPSFGAEFVGDFFVADYVHGWILRLDASAAWSAYAFAQMDGFVTGLAVGTDGALYVLVGRRVDRISR